MVSDRGEPGGRPPSCWACGHELGKPKTAGTCPECGFSRQWPEGSLRVPVEITDYLRSLQLPCIVWTVLLVTPFGHTLLVVTGAPAALESEAAARVLQAVVASLWIMAGVWFLRRPTNIRCPLPSVMWLRMFAAGSAGVAAWCVLRAVGIGGVMPRWVGGIAVIVVSVVLCASVYGLRRWAGWWAIRTLPGPVATTMGMACWGGMALSLVPVAFVLSDLKGFKYGDWIGHNAFWLLGGVSCVPYFVMLVWLGRTARSRADDPT